MHNMIKILKDQQQKQIACIKSIQAQLVQRSDAFYERPAANALNDTFAIQVREQYSAFYYAAAADRSLLPPVCGFDQTQRKATVKYHTAPERRKRRLFTAPHLSRRCQYE